MTIFFVAFELGFYEMLYVCLIKANYNVEQTFVSLVVSWFVRTFSFLLVC